ncbi:hepatic triacylglycerol lipase [Salmo trutta]|uniref:Hepatic triacylglycerol lipase n=1 Tax=Salmo trutta TaxID=8032 RepID=A0A674DUD7_SALTR|nr:hepatic triacylglycerol lipase [Salmo trutta]
MALVQVLRVLCCLLLTYHLGDARRIKGSETVDPKPVLRRKMPHITSTVFKLYSDGARDMEDWCTVEAFRPHTRTSCGFNSSHPLIIITHGWSINALMESWVPVLASALKTSLGDVNVIVTDWLLQANMNYPNAAQNTRAVGKDIAFLLQWLQEFYQFPAEKVHLIGYSLGAHVSGFAGSYLGGRGKIGRITGLDPAGPLFEGMAASDRLSPDDALFVDAIHTYTQERMGLSVGIKQPVAHVDFYPNGGDFQPGCHPFRSLMEHIALHGINGFEQTVKCAHERSVYLFIDSLLNKDKQIMAYRCRDDNAFEKGTCLDCRKNKCNTLGYNVRRVRSAAGKKLYHKTRSHMPYKLYHYQFRIQFVNQIEKTEPTLIISLTGTKEDSPEMPITFIEEISGNKTYTFLITLDSDIGDLMMLKFRWEGSVVNNVWSKMQIFNPWSSGGMRPKLTVGKIRVKAGETQNRTTFCAQTSDGKYIRPSQENVFVRCEENAQKQRRRKTRLS